MSQIAHNQTATSTQAPAPATTMRGIECRELRAIPMLDTWGNDDNDYFDDIHIAIEIIYFD